MRSFSLISSTTKDFIQQAWQAQRVAPWDFLHSYFYARWPYLYIAIASGEHPVAKLFTLVLLSLQRLIPRLKPVSHPAPSPMNATGTTADIYHGKVLPLSPAKELVSVNEPINLPDLEQVIPYRHARAIIQQYPHHILLVKCPCRLAKDDPCLPLDVCMVIGEPFASFTMQHYPSRARWITPEEACAVLEREDARGRVHHAFFSEMMLGRFFAICNCCACCCTAMAAHRRGTPMLASSGYVAVIDESVCNDCGVCGDYCQFGALGSASDSQRVDQHICMGCGVCLSKCPEQAISLSLEPSKGIPLEIHKLMGNDGRDKRSLEVVEVPTNISEVL